MKILKPIPEQQVGDGKKITHWRSLSSITKKPFLENEKKADVGMTKRFSNKTLGRARDPHAKGAWLNKLTE